MSLGLLALLQIIHADFFSTLQDGAVNMQHGTRVDGIESTSSKTTTQRKGFSHVSKPTSYVPRDECAFILGSASMVAKNTSGFFLFFLMHQKMTHNAGNEGARI